LNLHSYHLLQIRTYASAFSSALDFFAISSIYGKNTSAAQAEGISTYEININKDRLRHKAKSKKDKVLSL